MLSIIIKSNDKEVSRGAGVPVNRLVWIRSPLEEMKYLFLFSFLRSGVEGKARRRNPPLNTQCLQKSAASGERVS